MEVYQVIHTCKDGDTELPPMWEGIHGKQPLAADSGSIERCIWGMF